MEIPPPIFNLPPVADSAKLEVFGLIAKPVFVPDAVILAFMFTLLVAVNVRVVLAFQLTPSLIFILPETVCPPDAL